MSEINTSRTTELIAAEIVNIKEQTKKMVIYNSIEIGRRLVEAKEIVGHGEWGKWIEEPVSYTQAVVLCQEKVQIKMRKSLSNF